MSKVRDIGTAPPMPMKSTAQIRVDKDGDLVLRLPGSAKWAILAAEAEPLLERLLIQVRNARYRKMGVPPRPPEKAPVLGPGRCHRKRDGGVGIIGQGCRRRRGHTGQCRDGSGDYTPAICTHQGRGRTTIHFADGSGRHSEQRCAHCYQVTGPAPVT